MKPGQAEDSGKARQRSVQIRFSEPASTYFRIVPVLSDRRSPKTGVQSVQRKSRAFTLLELLLVVTIIAMLAGMALPHFKGLAKSNSMAAATRQLLDDVSMARQRALSGHTPVYMVFLQDNVMGTLTNQSAFRSPPLTSQTTNNIIQTLNAELRGYALVTLRTTGDQPGLPHPHYLTEWRKLPDGVYIAPEKFHFQSRILESNMVKYIIQPLNYTNFPFPNVDYGPNFALAYIKFNSQGQCVRFNPYTGKEEIPAEGEFIPLTRGSVFYVTNFNASVDVVETPPGESTNNYNLIHIDGMTGRAKLERKEIK